jgi:hypothetical protein
MTTRRCRCDELEVTFADQSEMATIVTHQGKTQEIGLTYHELSILFNILAKRSGGET